MRRDHQEEYLQSSSNHLRTIVELVLRKLVIDYLTQRISPDGVDWRLIFVSRTRRGLQKLWVTSEKWVAEAVSFTLVRYHSVGKKNEEKEKDSSIHINYSIHN